MYGGLEGLYLTLTRAGWVQCLDVKNFVAVPCRPFTCCSDYVLSSSAIVDLASRREPN